METPEDMKAKRKLFEASLLKIAKDGGIDGLIVFSDWMVKVFNFLVDFCSNIEKSSPYFFMVMEWYKARHMGFLGAITVVAGIVLASILTKFLKSVQPKRKKPQKKPQQQVHQELLLNLVLQTITKWSLVLILFRLCLILLL